MNNILVHTHLVGTTERAFVAHVNDLNGESSDEFVLEQWELRLRFLFEFGIYSSITCESWQRSLQ